MASSSSTKKAAKLAQKSRGRTIRFQGGSVFPVAVAIVLVLGLAAIVYGRSTLPSADETPPTLSSSWHHAYGFYLCDSWYTLSGDLTETDTQGNLVNEKFKRTGVNSNDDGIIYWQPQSSASAGPNAVLGVFLDNYDVTLTNDTLTFPPDNVLGPQDEYIEGESKCNGEDAELSVKVWDSYSDTGAGRRYIANMDRIRLDHDGYVIGIYFTSSGTDQTMPPSASTLPSVGSGASNSLNPDDFLPTDTSPVTIPIDTAPADTAPATTTG